MIKVFSSDSCGYCTKLKAYLDSRRVEYDVIDVYCLLFSKSVNFSLINSAKQTVYSRFVKTDNDLSAVENSNRDTCLSRNARIPLSAVFTYIGSAPRTELLRGSVELDRYGYIEAGDDMRTSVEGVFAAGDVRTKKYRQIVTAVSAGAGTSPPSKTVTGIPVCPETLTSLS